MSHAVWCHKNSPFPQVKLLKGSAFLNMGHTIRPSMAQIQAHIQLKESLKGKEKAVPPLQSSVELLPEEALYLLERGTMMIWQGEEEGIFHEEYQGYENMTEMTVLEGFSRFIGMEGLSLERYQVSSVCIVSSRNPLTNGRDFAEPKVYAGLRRLGYTVQRTPQFLPQRFRKPLPYSTVQPIVPSIPFSRRLLTVLRRMESSLVRLPVTIWNTFAHAAKQIVKAFSRARGSKSLLAGCNASTYGKVGTYIPIVDH
jgi:tRNA-splicing endonuclease subunit Sen54